VIRRNFALLCAFLVAFVTMGFGQAVSAETTDKKVINILHTNDSHGRAVEGEYDGMGFAKIATLVKRFENENPNTLLLDAGDTLHGTTFATLMRGESIVEVMNKVGYDGMAAGNHDFNYGFGRLLELTEKAEFPVMSANIRIEDNSLLLKPYTIKEVDGLKIGVFGLSTPETHYKTHPKNVEGLTFTDPVAEAKAMVTELEAQGVDTIIAVSHLGIDASSTDTSIKVAKGAPGIDLIVDGHSHTTLVNGLEEDNDTLIVSAGEYTKNLGVVTLEFEGNELVNKSAKLITKADAAEVTPDEATSAVIKGIQDSQEEILSEIVGKTEVTLDGERNQVRAGETNLGNLITDSMVDLTGADAAITNGGGIRASIAQGDITKGDVIEVLPFGNYIVTKNITGADIKAALENGVSAYPETKGAFPHVSGMTFAIDAAKPAGEKVHSVKINGQDLDLNKKYLVATNDFLAAGGDEYTSFKDAPIVNEFPSLDENLINYIQKLGSVTQQVEGRIVAKETPGEPDPEPTPVPTVYWDGAILKKGQIGRITIEKPIVLWKRNGSKLEYTHVLKPGSVYRVYGYDNMHFGQYNVGGGYWITKMNGYIKYETPSKHKLDLVN
jgi:5'-nucleotidase / UDP-sugar diphosphatase